MALPDFLQKIIPQRNSPDLKIVSRLKPPSIPRGATPPQQLEIAKNFLSQVAGEIQNNHFIPDNIISWLTQHTSLTKQQLTSPDLTPKFINQELARLTTLIIESATQTQTAPEVNTQNTTDNLDRLASRALPDLKRFIAEGVPHPEIALIILNNKSTTTRLQKIFTEELQNYPSNLQRAFTNTLIRASRTDPAVAAVMALAVQHTQTTDLEVTKETVGAKTLEKTTSPVNDPNQQTQALQELSAAATQMAERDLVLGTRQNLSQALQQSGHDLEIINTINFQVLKGQTNQSITNQLPETNSAVVTAYANNLRSVATEATGVSPTLLATVHQSLGSLPIPPNISPTAWYIGLTNTDPVLVSDTTRSLFNHVGFDFAPQNIASEISLNSLTPLGSEALGSITHPHFGMPTGAASALWNTAMSTGAKGLAWAGNKLADMGLAATPLGPAYAASKMLEKLPLVGGVFKKINDASKKVIIGIGAGLGFLLGKLLGLIQTAALSVLGAGVGAAAGFFVGNLLLPGVGGLIGAAAGGALGGAMGSSLAAPAKEVIASAVDKLGSADLIPKVAFPQHLAAQTVGGSAALLAGGTVLAATIATSTFLSSTTPVGRSQYLNLTKEAYILDNSGQTHTQLENDTGLVTIDYTITLSPETGTIINSFDSVQDLFSLVSDTNVAAAPVSQITNPSTFTKNDSGEYTTTYIITLNTNDYPDTAIINTVVVAASITTPDGQTITDSITATERILVGDPPVLGICAPSTGELIQLAYCEGENDYTHCSGNYNAVDIAAPLGTPIYAAHNGTVTIAGWFSNLSGYNVQLHNTQQGIATSYSHMLTAPLVTVGQEIATGELLGYIGNTGQSTTPHLHFSLLPKSTHIRTILPSYQEGDIYTQEQLCR